MKKTSLFLQSKSLAQSMALAVGITTTLSSVACAANPASDDQKISYGDALQKCYEKARDTQSLNPKIKSRELRNQIRDCVKRKARSPRS